MLRAMATLPVHDGQELRKLRRDAEVEVSELARHLKRSRKHIHDLEKREAVNSETAAVFRAGVEALRRAAAQ